MSARRAPIFLAPTKTTAPARIPAGRGRWIYFGGVGTPIAGIVLYAPRRL